MSVKINKILALFDIVEKEDKLTIRYGGRTLAEVKKLPLLQMIRDVNSKELKRRYFDDYEVEKVLKENRESPTISRALVFASEYQLTKRKFFGRGTIKEVSKTSKEFPDFVKAVELIKDLKTNGREFLDSQVSGLEFVNGNKGTFPKPNQLHGINAEDRFLNYKRSLEVKVSDRKSEKQIFINQKDRDTALMENPRFVQAYDRIKENSATLAEANFVKALMIERKGANGVTSLVKDYIKKLRNESKKDK